MRNKRGMDCGVQCTVCIMSKLLHSLQTQFHLKQHLATSATTLPFAQHMYSCTQICCNVLPVHSVYLSVLLAEEKKVYNYTYTLYMLYIYANFNFF